MAKDQLYLVRFKMNDFDGERIGVVQLTKHHQERAEKEAAKHFKKAKEILSVEPKTAEEINAAVAALNEAHPARPSVQELTGGEPIRLLADPSLADPDTTPLGS